MRRIYWIWATGLLLKGIGASWDVSWHFRILRESISPPHIINVIGGVLCALALWMEWRTRDPRRRPALYVVLAGVLLFLAAIPFDEWWHRTFGIDLTTWSPAHMMLFTGTMVSTFGVLLLFIRDMGADTRAAIRSGPTSQRLVLAFFLIVFAGSVYFPLTYNEYTTVAARTVIEAPETMDPELVERALSVDDPVFLGTPRWLYPVYSVAIAAFIGTLARAWLGRGWALVALGGISAERVAADAILGAVGFPQAALPLQFAAMGVAIELVWLVRAPAWASAVGGGILAAGTGYAYFVQPITWTDAVPLTSESWPAGVAIAVATGLAALALVRYGVRAEAASARLVANARAWIAEKWAPTDLNR